MAAEAGQRGCGEGAGPGDAAGGDALEDRVLVRRFLAAQRTGDREAAEGAFRVLVTRYQQRVHRLVHRYVQDPLEAEDLTQEVFLKVFRKLEGFQWGSAFFTWLYRIAVNTAADHLAKRRRRPLLLSRDLEPGPEPGESGRERRRGSAPERPEGPLLRAERAAITRRLLAELPEPYRTTLYLREFEDLSYLEIAEVLECSIGTVESRLFRARARFRRLLEERHPELLQD